MKTPARTVIVTAGIALAFSLVAGQDKAPDATKAATTASAPVVPPGMTAVETKLPKPMFVGTPKNIPPGTTVEKAPSKPRPPLIVPEGTKNLALKAPVTSSDKEPIVGKPELITDGDKEGADGSFVELGQGLQWVQIDLGAPCEVFNIIMWHFHADPRVYHDVVVQVADDQDFITNVRTLFNNDQDNSAGLGIGKDREYFDTYEGKAVAGNNVKARYVRLYSKGSTASDQNHYIEVEVYGKPAK